MKFRDYFGRIINKLDTVCFIYDGVIHDGIVMNFKWPKIEVCVGPSYEWVSWQPHDKLIKKSD